MATVAKLGNYVVHLPDFADRRNDGIVVTAYSDKTYCRGGAVVVTAVDTNRPDESLIISGLTADEWQEAFEHPFAFAFDLVAADARAAR